MSLDAVKDIDKFCSRYLDPKIIIHDAEFKNDLDALLCPAGFKTHPNENGRLACVYVRGSKSAKLFVPDDLFEDLFESHRHVFPAGYECRKNHKFSLVSLDANDIDDVLEQNDMLYDLWNREGATHRGYPDHLGYVIFKSVLLGTFGFVAGALPAYCYDPQYAGPVGLITGTTVACGSILVNLFKMHRIESERSILREEYANRLQIFRNNYEDRTLFDRRALEHAVSVNK